MATSYKTKTVSTKNITRLLFLYLFSVFLASANAEWSASSFSTTFKSGSVDSVCRAAINHHSGRGGGSGGDCPIKDEFSHVAPGNTRDQRACIATRTIGPCDYYPNEYSYNWGLGAVYTNKVSNEGDNCNNTSNPINISTGNKFFRHRDIKHPFLLTRYYNSFSSSWSFDYRQKIILDIDGSTLTAMRPDGSSIDFVFTDGVLVQPQHRRERLSVASDGFILSLPDNTIESYNNTGQLLSIKTPYETTTLTYSDNQILIQKNNNQLTLSVNDAGDVIAATLTDDLTITYSYQTINNITLLTRVIRSDGTIRNYLYEDTNQANMITGIVNENDQRIASVEYDEQGRAISSEKGPPGSGIERTQIQYHIDGTRTVSNALGKQSTYHFTQFDGEYKITHVEGHPSANCAGANQTYTYDDNGFVNSKTDWKGNITTYVHNERGQETSRTEASGTPNARTITTTWHSTLNLPTLVIEPTRQIIMTYDNKGHLLSRTVQPRN